MTRSRHPNSLQTMEDLPKTIIAKVEDDFPWAGGGEPVESRYSDNFYQGRGLCFQHSYTIIIKSNIVIIQAKNKP